MKIAVKPAARFMQAKKLGEEQKRTEGKEEFMQIGITEKAQFNAR